MKWNEIISLRTSGKSECLLAINSFYKILKTMGKEKPESISLFRHATLDTDLSVHILWETPTGKCNESHLGLQMHNIFLNYGLSTHTLWLLEETISEHLGLR